MAEYNPISIFLKTIIFIAIITASTPTITLLDRNFGKYDLTIYDNKSEPPVEPEAFKTNALPIPVAIPPYIAFQIYL